MLAEALAPQVSLESSLTWLNKIYWEIYNKEYQLLMLEKLGLDKFDKELVDDLFRVMEKCGSDFTNTFRGLSNVSAYLDEADDPIV